MLSIAKLKKGLVIDHIRAGQGIRVFNWLGLDKTPHTVAFVVNANSSLMGKKDLIKIDDAITINFDILGLIDPNITVNIIENEVIREKISLALPKEVINALKCRNPRCITSTETYISQVFHLENPNLRTYRCEYCDDIQSVRDFFK
jgi:aspartate carbamoyltransferase regulatory subunit